MTQRNRWDSPGGAYIGYINLGQRAPFGRQQTRRERFHSEFAAITEKFPGASRKARRKMAKNTILNRRIQAAMKQLGLSAEGAAKAVEGLTKATLSLVDAAGKLVPIAEVKGSSGPQV